MQRLDKCVANGHTVAKRYCQLLADLSVITPWQNADNYSGFHLYANGLKLTEIGKIPPPSVEALRASGVGVNLNCILVYRQPHYESLVSQCRILNGNGALFRISDQLDEVSRIEEVQHDSVVAVLNLAIT